MPVDLHLPTNEQGFYDLDDEMDSFVDMLFEHYRKSGKDREVLGNREANREVLENREGNRKAQDPKAEPIKIDVSHVKPLSEEKQDEYLQLLLGED